MADCCEGQTEHIALKVSGMKCEGCVERIEKGLKSLDGIRETHASLDDKTVAVSYDPGVIKRQDIEKTIENLGYRVQK